MNTITKNPALGCPRGHSWCRPHAASQGDDWHSHASTVTVAAGEFPVSLVLDGENGDPTIYFEIDEWSIAFGDRGEEIANLHEFADAIAAKLTWFTVGVEVLKKFAYSVDHEPGEPDHHYWELGRAGTEYMHAITYVPKRGWGMHPVTPDSDALCGGDIIAWAEEVADLRIAYDFLREACEVES